MFKKTKPSQIVKRLIWSINNLNYFFTIFEVPTPWSVSTVRK